MTTYTYPDRKRARRAARQMGLDPETLDFIQTPDGKTQFETEDAVETVTEVQADESVPETFEQQQAAEAAAQAEADAAEAARWADFQATDAQAEIAAQDAAVKAEQEAEAEAAEAAQPAFDVASIVPVDWSAPLPPVEVVEEPAAVAVDAAAPAAAEQPPAETEKLPHIPVKLVTEVGTTLTGFRWNDTTADTEAKAYADANRVFVKILTLRNVLLRVVYPTGRELDAPLTPRDPAPVRRPTRVSGPVLPMENIEFVRPNETLSEIARRPVKGGNTTPTRQQQLLIDLCIRPQGATTRDLYTTTRSTQGIPWRDLVANCAKRFGYRMYTTVGMDRRVSYHLETFEPTAVEPEVATSEQD